LRNVPEETILESTFEGFPRFVRGPGAALVSLATLCALRGVARAEEPVDPGSDDEDTLVAGMSPDELNEREYIVRPPAVERPSTCRPELQTHIRVAGTMYDERHPERSMALLGAALSPTALYRTGARLAGLQLLEIRPRAVLLSSDAEESPCWLKMERPNPNAPPPPPPAAPPPEQPKSKQDRKKAFTTEELQRGIQQIGPGIYRVDRSVLDQALARVPKLAKTTRTKTVKRNGQTVGMSLHRIEEGGLFEHLGLKRGDVLKTVNGFDFSSVDGMLSAKSQLSSAPRLSRAARGGRGRGRRSDRGSQNAG
jgi:type II secretory pathway component PulC